jgi:hypothetical protein
MGTPIKPDEIKRGDRIRKTIEYVAAGDGRVGGLDDHSYELIERCVPLLTKAGWYKAESSGALIFLRLDEEGHWYDINGYRVPANVMQQDYRNLVLMREEGELVLEVLKSVSVEYNKYNATTLEEDMVLVGLNYNVEYEIKN